MPNLLITGGSRGIGFAITKKFRQAGWQVASISRHPPPDPSVLHWPGDFSKSAALASLQPRCCEFAAQTDKFTLIHNAWQYHGGTTQELTADAFSHSLITNLVPASQLNRWLIPQMPPGSSILFIGSTLAEQATQGAAPYIIEKHALVGMMRALCQDTAGLGIHTACLCPGFTETEMLFEHLGDNSEARDAIQAHVTHRRLIKPSEIAELALFAAENPVINGAVLHANLGQIQF